MSDFDVLDETAVKPRGLGRGLNALFGDDDGGDVAPAPAPSYTAEIEKKVETQEAQGLRARNLIGVDQIHPSRFQPRKLFEMDTLEELAASIKEYGVLQPLLVREMKDRAGHYDLIAGERRWRAAQLAEVHEVPAIVLELDDLAACKVALIENLQREDLDPIDEAHGYRRLLEDYGQTQEQLAQAVGKSRPHITNMMRLLSLPVTVQAHLSTGNITMGHARALINAPDPEGLTKQVIAKGLSVRQTEKLSADRKGVEQKSRPRTASLKGGAAKDADTIALENDMTNALGMRVTIDSVDGKSGKLSIEFKSLDQLDEVLHRLAHFPGARLSG